MTSLFWVYSVDVVLLLRRNARCEDAGPLLGCYSITRGEQPWGRFLTHEMAGFTETVIYSTQSNYSVDQEFAELCEAMLKQAVRIPNFSPIEFMELTRLNMGFPESSYADLHTTNTSLGFDWCQGNFHPTVEPTPHQATRILNALATHPLTYFINQKSAFITISYEMTEDEYSRIDRRELGILLMLLGFSQDVGLAIFKWPTPSKGSSWRLGFKQEVFAFSLYDLKKIANRDGPLNLSYDKRTARVTEIPTLLPDRILRF